VNQLEFKWWRVGIYDVVTESDGRVIAKVMMGPGDLQPNQLPVPAKAWVYEKYIGEYLSGKKAREAAERWLKMGPPAK
jgi:hypothetical protein